MDRSRNVNTRWIDRIGMTIFLWGEQRGTSRPAVSSQLFRDLYHKFALQFARVRRVFYHTGENLHSFWRG
jgi:hypothetical protein